MGPQLLETASALVVYERSAQYFTSPRNLDDVVFDNAELDDAELASCRQGLPGRLCIVRACSPYVCGDDVMYERRWRPKSCG